MAKVQEDLKIALKNKVRCSCMKWYFIEDIENPKCPKCGTFYRDVPFVKDRYPTVSIVMAVKNRHEAFRNSLVSWSNLDYSNDYEFIIVDDASGSSEAIQKIATSENLPNLRYYRLESAIDRVPNIAWNFGMEQANNDFVIVTGCDLIISHKTVLRHILDGYKGYRISVLTYFLSLFQTVNLNLINWKNDPKKIEDIDGFWEDLSWDNFPNKLRRAAGLTTYLTGQYKSDWEWIGGFRDEEGHLFADHDLHQREALLKLGCETAPIVRAYHQYHPKPVPPVGDSYTYTTENEARLR